MSRGAEKSAAAAAPQSQQEKITEEYVISVLGEPTLERQRPSHAQILSMVGSLRQLLADWDSADLLRLLDRFLWNQENALDGALEGVMQKGDDWTEHQPKQKKKTPQQRSQAGGSRGRGGSRTAGHDQGGDAHNRSLNGAPGSSRGSGRESNGAGRSRGAPASPRGGSGTGRGRGVSRGRGSAVAGASSSQGKPVNQKVDESQQNAQQQQQQPQQASQQAHQQQQQQPAQQSQHVPQQQAPQQQAPQQVAAKSEAPAAAAAAKSAPANAGPALRGAWAERHAAKKVTPPPAAQQPQQRQAQQQQLQQQGRRVPGGRQQMQQHQPHQQHQQQQQHNQRKPVAGKEVRGKDAKTAVSENGVEQVAKDIAVVVVEETVTTTTTAAIAVAAPDADQLPSPQILVEEEVTVTEVHVEVLEVEEAKAEPVEEVVSQPPTDPLFIAPGLPGLDSGSFHFRFGVYGHDDDVEVVEKEEPESPVQTSHPEPVKQDKFSAQPAVAQPATQQQQAPVQQAPVQQQQPQQQPQPQLIQAHQVQQQSTLPPQLGGIRLDGKGQGVETPMPAMAHLPSFGPPGPFNPGYMFPHSMGPGAGAHPGSMMLDHFPYNTLPTDPSLPGDLRMPRGGYMYDPMQFHPYHPQQQQQQQLHAPQHGVGVENGQVGGHGRNSPSVGSSHYGGSVNGSAVPGSGSGGGLEKFSAPSENGMHMHGSHEGMMHQSHAHHPFPPIYYSPYGGQYSFPPPNGPSHMQRGGFYKPPGSPAGGYVTDAPPGASFFNDVKAHPQKTTHLMYHQGDGQDVRGGSGVYDKPQSGQGVQGQQGQGQGQQGQSDMHKSSSQSGAMGGGGYPMPFGFPFHQAMPPFQGQQQN